MGKKLSSYELFKSLKVSLGIGLLILISGCANNPNSAVEVDSKTTNQAVNSETQAQNLPITATVTIATETIKLEVARTPQEQAIGLMFRESLPDDRGMFFPFASEQVARFWMKNVSIPLDMVFLNGDRVIDVAINVPPCQTATCPVYGPQETVDGVLELRGGKAAELGIASGDQIKIKFLPSQ